MANASDSLRLGPDVDSGSPLLDLTELPLKPTLLREVGLKFRDALLENKMEREFHRLEGSLSDAIQNERTGFLIEVTLFVGEFGEPVIPGGQILYPIGQGMEPIDSLAEYLRYPQLRAPQPNPGVYQDNTFYYWIGKKDGHLVARTIPKVHRERLQNAAEAERSRRQRMGAWERSWPDAAHKSLVRAEYWSEVERDRAAALKTADHRQQVHALGEQMNALQKEFNDLYHSYQDVEREMQRCQEHLSTLQKIGTISSLIQNGMQAGKIFSADGKAAKGSDLSSPAKVPDTIEWIERKTQVSNEQAVTIERRMRITFGKIQNNDHSTDSLYRNDGVPVPGKDSLLYPIMH